MTQKTKMLISKMLENQNLTEAEFEEIQKIIKDVESFSKKVQDHWKKRAEKRAAL